MDGKGKEGETQEERSQGDQKHELVKYNFDFLEDQVPQKDRDLKDHDLKDHDQKKNDNYTLVWMVSNQNSKSVWKVRKGTFVTYW